MIAAHDLISGTVLFALATVEGSKAFMLAFLDGDWSKISGPHGVAFVSVVACISLWATYVRGLNTMRKDALEREECERIERAEREARERLEREANHTHLVKSNADNAEKLLAISVDVAKSNLKVAEAIHNMDRSIQGLSSSIEGCQANQKRMQ